MPILINSSQEAADCLSRVIHTSIALGSVRACLLTTRDRDHALNLVKETVVAAKQPLYHYTAAGRRHYQSANLRWEPQDNGPTDAASLLRQAQELRGGGVIVFEDCAAFLRDEGGDQRMRMTLAQMLSAETTGPGRVLVFLEPPRSEAHLPSILADQFVRLSVPYPRAAELEAIAREEIASAAHRTQKKLLVERIQSEAKRLGAGVAGLTRSAGRDALRDAFAPDGIDFETAYERLQARKADQLRRELAMNVLDTEEVEEPIGLDYLIEHLAVARDKMRASGPGRARGVILIGPPGTGKTMLARAIGKMVGLPVVEFRIAALMNSLLGETEQKFARAFSTLEAMCPNVVFIDEIEKAFGDSSERDGGTMMRCTGALLSWLSDNPHPNFIVATSNSLKRMGEIGLTMTRSERFDSAFFIDVPSFESRRRMLERWLKGVAKDHANLAKELASQTEKFSGADLRSLVKQAVTRAEHARVLLTQDHLLGEVERKKLRAFALYEEFQELRRWGRMFCDPAGPTDN